VLTSRVAVLDGGRYSPSGVFLLVELAWISCTGVADEPVWNDAANTSIALLRTEAGRDPHNRDPARPS
jgi:hypothetical protein